MCTRWRALGTRSCLSADRPLLCACRRMGKERENRGGLKVQGPGHGERKEAPDGLVFFNLVGGLLRTGEGCVSFAGKVNGRRTAERTMGGANQG